MTLSQSLFRILVTWCHLNIITCEDASRPNRNDSFPVKHVSDYVITPALMILLFT